MKDTRLILLVENRSQPTKAMALLQLFQLSHLITYDLRVRVHQSRA